MADNTLTITDNRTQRTYNVPIENGTIRAMDLRQIKTGAEDFGLMTDIPSKCWRKNARFWKWPICCFLENCLLRKS